MAELAKSGRDKVTLIASPGIADFGAWLEQLLAESTGKQGRGLIPLANEPLTTPEHYGSDRFFAYLELDGNHDESPHQAVDALERGGHPVAHIKVKDIWHIGQEFFRWEIAVAVAGAIIGIDPFNQPDVEASKDKTRALTADYEKSHSLPKQEPIFRENGLALYADPRNAAELGRHNTLTGYLKSHFGRVHAGEKSGDYVALLAYIQRDATHTQALTAMRTRIRDKTRAATCLGFGRVIRAAQPRQCARNRPGASHRQQWLGDRRIVGTFARGATVGAKLGARRTALSADLATHQVP